MLFKVPTTPSQALYYGSAAAPLVRIMPDPVYPDMWRMVWPDGSITAYATSDYSEAIRDAGGERSG